MTFATLFLRPLRTLATMALGAGLLAGCAASGEVAVKCPEIRIPQNTDRMTRFVPGDGRDITDVRLKAEIRYLSGTCEVKEETISMSFPLVVGAQRGPANTDGVSDVAVFVAVAKPDRTILNRRELPFKLTFPGNKVRVIAREPLTVDIPKTAGQGARDFLIFMGFALTRDELDYNRSEERLR
jgi:hypothetical protein